MRVGPIEGLAGVLIWTEADRFPAMARFYRDTLGLAPRSAKSDFINFDWSGVRLSVGVHDRVEVGANDRFRVLQGRDDRELAEPVPEQVGGHDGGGDDDRHPSEGDPDAQAGTPDRGGSPQAVSVWQIRRVWRRALPDRRDRAGFLSDGHRTNPNQTYP